MLVVLGRRIFDGKPGVFLAITLSLLSSSKGTNCSLPVSHLSTHVSTDEYLLSRYILQGILSGPTFNLTSCVVGRTLVVGREFESHVHQDFFSKESEFPHSSLTTGYPEIVNPIDRTIAEGTYGPIRGPRARRFEKSEKSVMRLELSRRLVTTLYAQRISKTSQQMATLNLTMRSY